MNSADNFNRYKIYDISMTISPGMPVYPGDPRPDIKIHQDYSTGGCRVSRLRLGSHTGTHVDAPGHFIRDGVSIDRIPLKNLAGPARVVEVPPGQIKIEAIPSDLKNGEIILFKTAVPDLARNSNGSAKRKKPEMFSTGNGTSAAESGMIYRTNKCPHIDIQAANRLVSIGAKAVGIDSLSIESPEGDGSVHRLLLSNSIPIIEGLVLKDVPPGEYFFVCLPLKIENCDGSPARAILIK
ncbi:cyclase family protein [Thermoanaerobacterium sp. DL9XJH110]|uniref:cyclase family protein n=1 Tax=Thermoanaerobacterium sp. DL9XJH110 TaxID=3386643 RepID=UPI003BB73ECF